MLAIERKQEILDKLRLQQHVVVSELSLQYQVTEETIRRDLDKLEKEGYCTKTYGGCTGCHGKLSGKIGAVYSNHRDSLFFDLFHCKKGISSLLRKFLKYFR